MKNNDDAEFLIAEEVLDANGITFSGLDPILGSLGEMVGLLDKPDLQKDLYELNNLWFTDPINKTKEGFTQNASNLSDVLAQILGKVGGNALGIPVTDPALLGTWYPVKYNDQNTGLYFVSYQKDKETVLGIGVLHTWDIPEADPIIKVDVWGMLPFIRVGDGQVNITFTDPGYPATLGIALEGAGKDPLVKINDVQFNGVKVNASIDFAASTPFGISIQVLQLQLPGDETPTDRTLADLEAITGQQILETASSLFVGALSKVFTDQATQTRIAYFPALIGLTSIVPNSKSRLPVLEWYQLFNIAANPSKYPEGAATPFLNWFNTLSTNPDQLKTWLSCLGGFLNGAPVAATGAGTRSNPFAISIISVNGVGKLNFTVGTNVVSNGERYFYPGLSFAAVGIPISTSDIVFNIDADLEMAQFQLSGANISAEPTVNFSFKGQLANKTAWNPLIAFGEFSFGNLEGGLSFGLSGSVVPYFNLNKVKTPSSSFEVINLLSPSQLANAGAAALSDGIKKLLGLSSDNTFSNSVASLIGFTPPDTDGAEWPVELAPPFDAGQMINSISNPLGAWANYYLDVLKFPGTIGGKTAFTYIVQDFAQLLNAATGTGAITVTGDGTPDSPWKAGISLAENDLPAYLTSYNTQLKNGDTRLFIGLSLEPSITVAGVEIVPSLAVDVVYIDILADGSAASGNWLPLVAAQLTLPKGFKTPELGGVSFSVDKSQLSGSWSRTGGWGWSLFVNNPTLKIDENEIKLNQNLNFADTEALEKLVKEGVATFGPFLTGAVGAFLMRTQTRAGLLSTGVLGFLTDLTKSPIFPEGFKWEGFKQFEITSFLDPWPDLLKQLASDLETTDKAKSTLALLGWTINTDMAAPPAISGSGSFTDPYTLPIPAGFEFPVWYDVNSEVVGLGIGRTDVYNYDDVVKFRFVLQTRLNAIEFSLDTGKIVNPDNCPNLSFIGTLSNPDGLLIDLPLGAGSVEKVLLGFNLGVVSNTINFRPVVTLLGVKLAGEEKRETLTLEEILDPDFAAALQSSFYHVLNAAVQAAIDQVKDVAGFKTAYDLLSLMGLTTDWDEAATPQGGINVAGWTGLIADYNSYIRGQLSSLLTNSASRGKLFAFLENTFDITLPQFPKPLLDVLSALQICGPADEGYPLLPQALLEIASNPVQSLKKRFGYLFANEDLLKALTKELTQQIPSKQFGNFTFGADSNGVISLAVLPEFAFKLGSFVNFTGALQLDLVNQKLALTVDGFCPVLGLALNNVLTLSYPLDPDDIYKAAIIWGDGTKPSAEPLPLYPFDGGDFVSKLSKIAPAYVLNIVSNAVLEDSLLKKYPLVQQIFSALGIAGKTEELQEKLLNAQAGDAWSMDSILGILRDPLGWLLSDEVLGLNGKFNIGKLAELLSKLPEVKSTSGIAVNPLTNGVKINGLPFGMGFSVTGKDGVASFGFDAAAIEIAGGKGKLDNLGLQIDLDANYQPAFSGKVDISTNAVDKLFATIGYDKGFLLKVAQGTPAEPSGLALQLLPFLGWGNLAGEAASLAAATLVQKLTPVLLDELKKTAAKDFVEDMESFAGKIAVKELFTVLLAILTPENFQNKTQAELLGMIEGAALGWLKGRFSITQAPVTADAVKELLSGLLPTQLTTDKGLILYKPSESLPVVIKAGLNGQNLLGLWAGVTLPALEIVDISISDAGAGINIDTGDLNFSFGVDVLVPIEKSAGPSLSLQYVNGKGFVMVFDPIADPANPSKQSDMARQFLPEFFPKGKGDPAELSARVANWIFAVFKNVIPRYISVLVLNIESVKGWLEAPIIGTDTNAPTPAFILEAASLVLYDEKEKLYRLNTIDALLSLSPEEFFGNFLKALMKQEITLLTFGPDKKSKIKIGPELNNPGSYGLHLFAPNLKVPSIPNLVLQIGDSDNEWITESGGVTGDPGIGIYLPIDTEGNIPSADFTRLNFILNNIGFDMVGTNGKPLVDLTRFVIGAIKPRVLFDLNLNGGDPKVNFGAGVTLEDIGISLAPNTMAPGDSKNPIASNLLGSGSESEPTNNPPSNPTFSVTAAYSTKLYVNLKSKTGNGKQVIVPVQRSFGPLYVDSLGLGWDPDKILEFLFSGSVDLAGLKTTLIGLTVGVPVITPTKFNEYRLDLQGIDISFQGGAVAVEAGLFKQTDPYLMYNGSAVIKGGNFSVMALASYAEMVTDDGSKEPSLFIFGVLNMPLGGPPAFFVTGIAAGFAYNRGLVIPAIDKVQEFPLVLGLSKGTFTSNDPGEALKQLSDVVPPQIGQYWLAAGIKFKSFGMINTSALLFLSFGRDWELNILGLSYASLPPEIKPDIALAYFELAIKISFKFTAGIISAEAQLTPNSFVLTKDCKVTGGFAFYLWYKKQVTDTYQISAGDFVITLGGYHPAFARPVYYPDVPRLGMLWKMSIPVGSISINGGVYFALCPTAVMAGGYLNVNYELGPLSAWLEAYANFLIEWNPFYFNVGIGITVGVSFGTTIAGVSLTIRAELGAKLQLEGPPIHGYVKIDWYVISFTIPIGGGDNGTVDKPLDWELFEQSFLPRPEEKKDDKPMYKGAALAAEADEPVKVSQVVKWSAGTGMQSTNADAALWTVNPVPFAVSVQSAIPANDLEVTNSSFNVSGKSVGVRPMNFIDDLEAPMAITVTDSSGAAVNLTENKISLTTVNNGAPSALWSKEALNRDEAPNADTLLIDGALFGLTLTADQYVFHSVVPPFNIENLKYDRNDVNLLPFANTPTYPAADKYDDQRAYMWIRNTIMDAGVIKKRNEVLAALRSSAILAPASPDLSVMATFPELIFQDLPVLARLGIYQNGGVAEAGIPVVIKKALGLVNPPDILISEPKLVGIFKRYVSNADALITNRLKAGHNDESRDANTLTMPGFNRRVRASWTDKTLLNQTNLRTRQLTSLAPTPVKLYDGSVAIWKVDPAGKNMAGHDGGLPVFVLSFNAYHVIIGMKLLTKRGEYLLPDATAQTVVQGYVELQADVIGWQKDSLLSKVNPVWSLADGVLIRMQNSQRTAVPDTGGPIGLLDASTLLRNNQVRGVNGLKPGWVQSIFPGTGRFIAVLTDNIPGSGHTLSVSVAEDKIPLKTGLSQPVHVYTRGDKTVSVYQAPPAGEENGYVGIIAKSSGTGLNILGMYSGSQLESLNEENWHRLTLHNGAIDLGGADNQSANITIKIA